MPEIDPVVVELIAQNGRYVAEMQRTATRVDASLAQQERSIKDLERQMRSSSADIAGSLRGVAGAFAGAFSVQQIAALTDSFTRLQNSLKVAGLEGEGLATVQARLLSLSQQNGVSIEGLATLYGGIARSQRELGASSEQLVGLTQATAESLRITGTSTTAASGAILGLSQALSAGTVRAEEYNQILEGGLQPLLQAVANTDRFGGSLARLRAAVVDGTVSSRELYQGILANAPGITEQASRATLTLAGGFEALKSSLIVFIGEADRSSGASAALASALRLIADNLDILIPAIAAVGAIMVGRYVAGAVAARYATLALTAAQLGAAGAAGTLGVAIGTTGRVLLAAFGGPVGAAIIAVGGAIYYVSQQFDAAGAASAEYTRQLQAAETNQRKVTDATTALAGATGRAREEALANARAVRAETAEYLQNARAALAAARAKAQARIAELRAVEPEPTSATPSFGDAFIRAFGAGVGAGAPGAAIQPGQAEGIRRERRATSALADQRAATAAVARAEAQIATLDRAIAGIPQVSTAVPASGGTRGRGGGSGGASPRTRSGPDPERIAQQFASELANLQQTELQARLELATSAEERADIQQQLLGLERDQALAAIQNSDYTAAQKAALREMVTTLFGRRDAEADGADLVVSGNRSLRAQLNAREQAAQRERDAADLARQSYENEREVLDGQYDLADSQAERRSLAERMVALEYDYQQSLLEAVIASRATTEAEKERARLALAGLSTARANATERARRGTETPAQEFMRELNRSADAVNEDFERIQVEGLRNLNDGIADAILGARSLGDVFKNVANSIIRDLLRIAIQQAVIQPIANSLFGGGNGGGGGIGSLFSSLFGRASGGYVAPGQVVRVNEGASPGRVEGFVGPSTGGRIVPLGQMNAAVAQGGSPGTATVRLVLSGDIRAEMIDVATGVSVQVVREAAPSIRDASVAETARQLGRVQMR